MSFNLGQQVPKIATSDGPAWLNCGNKTLLAWKGGSDSKIFWSQTNSLVPDAKTNTYTWTPQQDIPNVGTSATPALANLKGVAYLAWKGEGSDQSIHMSKLDSDGKWASATQVSVVGGTSAGPGLAAVGDVLHLVWKEEGGSRIFWSSSSDLGKTWSAQSAIPEVGTSMGPALASNGAGALYLAWKGESDESILWSKCTDGKTWAAQKKASGGATTSPSLAVDGNQGRLWIAFSAAGNNAFISTDGNTGSVPQSVYFTSLTDEAKNLWTPAVTRLGAATSFSPALISTGDSSSGLMVVWSSPSDNNAHNISYAQLLLPDQILAFILPSLSVKMMRSGTILGKTSTDTVYASISVKIKGGSSASASKFVGELTGGQSPVNLIVPNVKIKDTDSVYFHYSVINSSKGASAAAQFLDSIATQVYSALEKADSKVVEEGTFEIASLSALTPREQGAFVGAQLGFIVGTSIALPGLGEVLGGLVGWFATDIWTAFCPNCDGPVAFGMYVLSPPQIRNTLMKLGPDFLFAEDCPGVNSAAGCGENSHYLLNWNVTNLS